MRPTGEIGKIAKDFLSRFPTIPSRRIARWINEKHPEYSIEVARTSVRYYRGQKGVESRVGTGEFYDQNYDLPLPSTYDSSDFRIKESGVLILADLQIPFHDLQAIKATLKWGKDYSEKHHKVTAVLLDGDMLDLYQLSVFSKDPRERNIKEEFEDFKDILETIMETFPGAKIYYKYGNHEERFDHYIYRHAEQLGFLETFNLETALDLKKYGVTVIKDKRIIKIGHLNVVHGHEFRGGLIASVNPARTFFLRAKAPTLGGDRHMTSEHSGRTIDGKLITCWSIGCLSDLKPRYMPMNEWNHGFAFVRNDGKNFRVLNLRIEAGIVY